MGLKETTLSTEGRTSSDFFFSSSLGGGGSTFSAFIEDCVLIIRSPGGEFYILYGILEAYLNDLLKFQDV